MVQAEFNQKLKTIKSKKMTLKFCDKSKTPYSWIQIHVFLKMRIAFLCFSLLSTSKWHFQVPKKVTYVTTHMLSSGSYWFPLFYPFCMCGHDFFQSRKYSPFSKISRYVWTRRKIILQCSSLPGDNQVLL